MTLKEFKNRWVKVFYPNMTWDEYKEWCSKNTFITPEMLHDAMTIDFATYHINECKKEIQEDYLYYLKGDKGSEKLNEKKFKKEFYPLENIK